MANDDHPPAFLLYAQDFVSDSKVEAMTTREVGAYFLLLCKAWHETPVGTIPNNDRVLARWARLTPDEWAECRDAVLSPFRACTDNRLLSPRLSSEYRKLMESRRKKSIAGKAGAERRWQRHGDVIPDAWQCHDSANAEAMPKNAISSSISKETTHPLPPALPPEFPPGRRECVDDSFGVFESSYSDTFGRVMDVYAEERKAAGRGIARDANTREGARKIARDIDANQVTLDQIRGAMRKILADPNLKRWGLRGIADNYGNYLEATDKREEKPKVRIRFRCGDCGLDQIHHWSNPPIGDETRANCTAPGCKGVMVGTVIRE